MICFDELEKWVDDVEGCTPEMAQTVATALRVAWRSLGLEAKLERVFSAAKLVFGDEKRKNCNLYRLLMLRFNGYPCLLPHYVEKWKSGC